MQHLVSRVVWSAFVRGRSILRHSTNDSTEFNEGELISAENDVMKARTKYVRPSERGAVGVGDMFCVCCSFNIKA